MVSSLRWEGWHIILVIDKNLLPLSFVNVTYDRWFISSITSTLELMFAFAYFLLYYVFIVMLVWYQITFIFNKPIVYLFI